MLTPADHAVASVTGAEVADYAVASEAKDGYRVLKIIFKQPVMNRQLISVRLEKNEAAKAGAWKIQPLGFPGAKSRRGYIGAAATAGYRLVAAAGAKGLAEVPITFFPRKTSDSSKPSASAKANGRSRSASRRSAAPSRPMFSISTH